MALQRASQRNLAICGFYGAHQAAVAQRVAQQLHRPLVDIAAEMERRQRLNMFRFASLKQQATAELQEEWVVRDLAYRRETVIVLRPLTLANSRNLDELRVYSYIVCLDPPFEKLWPRIQDDGSLALMLAENGEAGMRQLWQEYQQSLRRCHLHAFTNPEQIEFTMKIVLHCFLT